MMSAGVRVLSGMVIAAAVVTAPLQALQQSSGPLKIVVIEGEGAVNIIQQKTAVAPVIEVRDRNDQPVAGATVNFVIRAGRATFGGARTLSVTTNAAGRAAAAGFAPSGTGALQIGATATFQGQAATAVTIAQTNVMTAAEAAAASAASGASGSGTTSAAGGAGAGGGGMSTTTLAIVGGAIAGGAVVAQQTLFSGTTYSTKFNGIMPYTTFSDTGFQSCTTKLSLSATLAMKFDSTESPLSGEMTVDDTEIRVVPTCPGDADTGADYFPMEGGTVSGSRDNVSGTGRHENNYTDSIGSGTNAYDFTFTGRFDSDDQMSGSLTVTRIVTWRTTTGITGVSRGTVTVAVTLRK